MEAIGERRPTDRFSEFHDGLVERSGVPRGENGGERPLEARADPRVANVSLLPGPTSRDAEAVRLERDGRFTEGDRRHRPCDVGTHTGERLEFGDRAGEGASVLPEDLLRGFVQAVSTRVVPRPLPELEDPADGRMRESLDGGEGPDEPLEVRDRLGDPRLLQEDLGDPDPVRLPISSPGERSPFATVPANEGRPERGRKRQSSCRNGSHGPRPADVPGA